MKISRQRLSDIALALRLNWFLLRTNHLRDLPEVSVSLEERLFCEPEHGEVVNAIKQASLMNGRYTQSII
jgi:hypothetical protein